MARLEGLWRGLVFPPLSYPYRKEIGPQTSSRPKRAYTSCEIYCDLHGGFFRVFKVGGVLSQRVLALAVFFEAFGNGAGSAYSGTVPEKRG